MELFRGAQLPGAFLSAPAKGGLTSSGGRLHDTFVGIIITKL